MEMKSILSFSFIYVYFINTHRIACEHYKFACAYRIGYIKKYIRLKCIYIYNLFRTQRHVSVKLVINNSSIYKYIK